MKITDFLFISNPFFFLLVLQYFQYFLCSCIESTKESTPCEKPVSPFAADFSGIAELTGRRPVQRACNSLSEKPVRLRGFLAGIVKNRTYSL